MWESRICRVCLNGDTKLYNMKYNRYKDIYESLTGIVVRDSGFPDGACAKCLQYLNKFSKFKDECLTAYNIMLTIVNSGQKITKSIIKSMTRESYNLKPTLSYSTSGTHSTFTIKFVKSHALAKNYKVKCQENVYISTINIAPRMRQPSDVPLDDSRRDDSPEFELNLNNVDSYECANKTEKKSEIIATYPCCEETEEISIKKEETQGEPEHSDLDDRNDTEFTPDESLTPLKLLSDSVTSRREKNTLGEPRKKKSHPSRRALDLVRKRDRRFKNPKDIEGDFVIERFLTEAEQKTEFERRRETPSYKESRYKCEMCLRGFREEKLLLVHMKKHEINSGEYICSICHVRMATQRRFRTHRDGNHTSKYTCKCCHFVTFSKAQARNHQKWHQGVEHKCPHCHKTFRKYTTFMGHLRLIHPSQHICGSCAHSFVSPHGLNHHRKVVHKTDDSNLTSKDKTPCLDCKVEFDSYKVYVKHLLISPKHECMAGEIIGCRECGEEFSSRELLAQHKHRKEEKEETEGVQGQRDSKKQAFQCSQCEQQFTHPTSVYQHFIKTHPNVPYKAARQRNKDCLCEECGKTFMCQSKLAAHRRLHTGERPYGCAQCGKAFRTRVNLAKHAASHAGLRPHRCGVCGKPFTTAGNLFKHTRIHTGVKSFKCDICNKAFVDSSNLTQHVQGVHYNVRRTRKR